MILSGLSVCSTVNLPFIKLELDDRMALVNGQIERLSMALCYLAIKRASFILYVKVCGLYPHLSANKYV